MLLGKIIFWIIDTGANGLKHFPEGICLTISSGIVQNLTATRGVSMEKIS